MHAPYSGVFRKCTLLLSTLVRLSQRPLYLSYASFRSASPSTDDYATAAGLAQFSAGVSGQLAFGIGTFIYQPDGGAFLPTPGVAAILASWAAWFKVHRTLLSAGDLIHVRRPDGASIDIVLHARAVETAAPGLAVFTNPTAEDLPLQNCLLPLYYTGLPAGSDAILLWGDTNATQRVTLDGRARALVLNTTVPARSLRWMLIAPAA